MMLRFDHAAHLQQVLETELIPASLRAAPSRAHVSDNGEIWIEPASSLGMISRHRLRRHKIGIHVSPRIIARESIADWIELLPLRPVSDSPSPAAALFLCADAPTLTTLISELWRLGCRQMSLRWRDTVAELFVSSPPAYSLLRARIDGDRLHVFVEQLPDVWVAYGWEHPIPKCLVPPEGEEWLLTPPRRWARRPISSFSSIQAIESFPLPSGPIRGEVQETSVIEIPATLGTLMRDEPAELWLLRDSAEERLHRFVSTADERLLEQLHAAVVERAGFRQIAILGRAQRGLAPILVADAEPFVSVAQIPNLFRPRGRSIRPPMRREEMRRRIAPTPDIIHWLEPTESGIAIHGIAASTFRPLLDFVTYQEPARGAAIRPTPFHPVFSFPSFNVKGEMPKKVRSTADPRPGSQDVVLTLSSSLPAITVTKWVVPSQPEAPAPIEPVVPLPNLPALPHAERRVRLIEKQREFLALSGPPDTAARLAAWPVLADLFSSIDETGEAALCRLFALWELGEPPADWLHAWLRDERVHAGRTLDAHHLDSILTASFPTMDQIRHVAAGVVASLGLAPNPALRERAAEIATFFEKHEPEMPVRLAWLAWLGLARISGMDLLSLARARDRILSRLLENGLSRDRDLPSFLRQQDAGSVDRSAVDRERLNALYVKAVAWDRNALSRPILNLTFAFAFAQIKESLAAEALLKAALQAIKPNDRAMRWLHRAYSYRTQQALEGAGTSSLPESMRRELRDLNEDDRRVIDLRRRVSRILEPHESIDPFRASRDHRDDTVGWELRHLADLAQTDELARALVSLRRLATTPRNQLRIYGASLRFAPRLGEGFSAEILGLLEPLLPGFRSEFDQYQVIALLERMLLLAAHLGREEAVPRLSEELNSILSRLTGERLAWALGQMDGGIFRTLGRLGRGEEVLGLVSRLFDQLSGGKSLAEFRVQGAVNWPIVARALVRIAAGHFYLEDDTGGIELLDEVRTRLFRRDFAPEMQAELAASYAGALGHATPEAAWPRLHDLFDRLDTLAAPYGVNSGYLQCELRAIEAALLGITTQDFAGGSALRRWLDEDEYLVRRRIHADMRHALEQSHSR